MLEQAERATVFVRERADNERERLRDLEPHQRLLLRRRAIVHARELGLVVYLAASPEPPSMRQDLVAGDAKGPGDRVARPIEVCSACADAEEDLLRDVFGVGVLTDAAHRQVMLDTLLSETTTLGVREHAVTRTVLDRRHETVQTPWGPVRVKLGLRGAAVLNATPEFEDCRAVATKAGVPIKDVQAAAVAAFTRR